MHNLTLVTALFDIGRGNLEWIFTRPFDKYLTWFKDLLQVDIPMVIFCEPELDEFIFQHRNGSTKIIHLTLNDIKEQFPFYDDVQKIRTSPEWLGQAGWLKMSPQGALNLYNPLVMSKPYLMARAADESVFNSDYFLWVDGGIANTVPMELFEPPFEKNVIKHLDKPFYINFPYRDDTETHGFTTSGLDKYARQRVEWVTRATIFGGSVYKVMDTSQYTTLLRTTLADGYMGTEENIFTLMTHLTPDLYNTYTVGKNGIVKSFLESLR